MTENNKENDNRFDENQESKDIINSYEFYIKQHEKMIDNFMKNSSVKNCKYNEFAPNEYLTKSYDIFLENICRHNSEKNVELIFSNFGKFYKQYCNSDNIDLFNVRVKTILIIITLACIESEQIDKVIKFLQEIQEETFKFSNKTFKFQFLACYIHLYISSQDYDNAYKYCMEAGNFITEDVELYYYSALNLIFDKQNKTECFENTQKIIKILINNKKLNFNNYCAITRFNSYLSKDNNKFLELANYFCKKALKNTSDRHQKGELLFVLSGFYHDLKKYYLSIGYGKITLKYTENKNTILDTLEAIASSYYCLSKFKNALAIYQQIMNLEISDKAKVYMQIGDCKYQLGEVEAMKENIKKAYLIGSKDTQVQKNINETYSEMKRGVYDSFNDI